MNRRAGRASIEVSGRTSDGTFDVGGRRLYLQCQGSVPPTVVDMHGSIADPSVVPHVNGGAIMGDHSGEHRVCGLRPASHRSPSVEGCSTCSPIHM
jgi:hypothetical protein